MYAPALLPDGGFGEVFCNPVIRSLPTEEFLAGIAEHFHQVNRHIMRDVPGLLRVSVFLLAAIGLIRMSCERNSRGATLLLAMLLGTGGLFLLKHSFPFTRNRMFLIPFVLIYADIGFPGSLRRCPAACSGLHWPWS